ncbi:lipoprotein [Spirochaetia bacterium]|nr:lipoprotein [Spirochaetia bacterium]
MYTNKNVPGAVSRIVRIALLLGGLSVLFVAPAGLTGAVGDELTVDAEPDSAALTEAVMEKIAACLSQGDFSGAIGLFDELPSDFAAASDILIIKASILNSAQQFTEGRAVIQQVIRREPHNLEALYVLSVIEAGSGREREQKQNLEQIIRQDPKHVRALCALADIAFRTQTTSSLRTAATYYDRALAADPQNGDALVGRAKVYRQTRNPQKAEELLNRAIRLYPSWADPRTERARIYRDTGFFRNALADLEIAKRLDGGNYWISCDLGTTLLDLNRKEESLAEFNRAIGLNPDNFLAYIYRAGLRDEAGDFDGAEQDYEKIIQLNPGYYFAFEGLGIHKMRKGQWAQARDAFLSAFQYAPTEYNYALLAALAWMRAERANAPREFLEAAMRKAPRDSYDYSMLRLFATFSGDDVIAAKLDRETNLDTKAKMLYYLGQYYDIRGNPTLANRYFTQVLELGQRRIIETRLNALVAAERNLALVP